MSQATKNVMNYFKKSIVNQRRANWKTERDNRSISEEGYRHQAELKLHVLNEILEEDLLYKRELNYVMMKLFQYLETHHEPYEIYVFKIYYFSGRKLRYSEISALLNIKEWAIDNILKKLRKSLRENLITYIEMQDLYQRIKDVMSTGGVPREKFHVAVELYKELHPDKYKSLCMGCRGKSIKIMNAEFRTFLLLNKKKYETNTESN